MSALFLFSNLSQKMAKWSMWVLLRPKAAGHDTYWEFVKYARLKWCFTSSCALSLAIGLALRVHNILVLTVGALLSTSPQQQFGHGHVVGHDGDIEGQEALTVWSVEVQLLQTVLGQEQLHQVQLLVLYGLEQCFITLKLRQKEPYVKGSGGFMMMLLALTSFSSYCLV